MQSSIGSLPAAIKSNCENHAAGSPLIHIQLHSAQCTPFSLRLIATPTPVDQAGPQGSPGNEISCPSPLRLSSSSALRPQIITAPPHNFTIIAPGRATLLPRSVIAEAMRCDATPRGPQLAKSPPAPCQPCCRPGPFSPDANVGRAFQVLDAAPSLARPALAWRQ